MTEDRGSAKTRRAGSRLASRRQLRMLGAILALAAPIAAADAHHSFAMFDKGRKIIVTGQVKEFQWVNPHTWIQLVAADRGRQVEWSIEGRSPNVLSRRGWMRTTLKPGDRISATIYPLKNGKSGGAIISIRFADGRVLDADTPDAVDTNEQASQR
jgi:hypothetical protein